MIRGTLAGLALTALAASGAAWGQNRPSPEEALDAVSKADCERIEAPRYVRFYCEEAETLWYFTRDGRPEHPGYFVAPAVPLVNSPFVIVPEQLMRERLAGTFGHSKTPNQRDFMVWARDVRALVEADAAEIQSRPRKRDRGKIYPLEPS